jgi:hypothetical protein
MYHRQNIQKGTARFSAVLYETGGTAFREMSLYIPSLIVLMFLRFFLSFDFFHIFSYNFPDDHVCKYTGSIREGQVLWTE